MNGERREKLMSVAARLFREKGFRATTMDDIASEMNLTKAALYYYVDSKNDLLYEICDSAIGNLLEGVREIAARDLPPLERLRELILWHVGMFSRYGDFINVYLAEEGELEEGKRRHMRSLSREFERVYREVMREAVARGDFRPVDVPMTVRALSGMCNWLSVWYRPEGELSAERVAETFYDLIVNGCAPRQSGEGKPAGRIRGAAAPSSPGKGKKASGRGGRIARAGP